MVNPVSGQKGNFVRGMAFRVSVPKSSKIAARVIIRREFGAPRDKSFKAYFPTIELIRQKGFMNGFREIDRELKSRDYTLSRSSLNFLIRLFLYSAGGSAGIGIAQAINKEVWSPFLGGFTFGVAYVFGRFVGYFFEERGHD